MVNAPVRVLRRLAEGIRGDITGFSAHVRALRARDDCAPGLYAYRAGGNGGDRRLHLRIEQDGAALLFVNASDVIHLNPTAARMAKLALDEVPSEHALARLRLAYPKEPASTLSAELRRVTEMVAALSRPTDQCPTCELALDPLPLFSVRARAPYKADVALHYACNNACAHCYNEPGRRDMPSLSGDQWQTVLRKLHEIGVPHLIFTGGEPTLHPALLELVESAEDLGQITGVNTNGRRLADRAFAARLKAAGLDHVQVTLNSHHAEVHDRMVGAAAFGETVAGIRNALGVGVHTITNTTLVRDNVDEAPALVQFLHGLGIRTFAMNGMIHSGCGTRFPTALTEAELAPTLRAVKERADALAMRFLWYTPTRYCRLSPTELGLGLRCCNAGEYSICIEPNGEVLPCQSYYEPAGNILRDDWDAIWESDLLRRFRHRREKPDQSGLPERCWDCEELPVCGGGCALEREATTTSPPAPSGEGGTTSPPLRNGAVHYPHLGGGATPGPCRCLAEGPHAPSVAIASGPPSSGQT